MSKIFELRKFFKGLSTGTQLILLIHVSAILMIFLMSTKGESSGFTISDGKSMLIFYINQTYWIITTLSTVGYGDFNADGDMAYMVLLIFIELFGLIAFSKIVGEVFTNKSKTTVQDIID